MFEGFCCSWAKTSSSMSWSLFTRQIATRDMRIQFELRDNSYDLIGDTFLKKLIILKQWPVGSEIAFQPIHSTSFGLHADCLPAPETVQNVLHLETHRCSVYTESIDIS